MDWKPRLYVPNSCFLSGSTCASKPSFVLVKLDSHIQQILLSAGATWVERQFHCEVSCKDRSRAAEDKAEKGLASSTFLLTQRDTQHNQTHNATKHSTGAMLAKKKKNEEGQATGLSRWMWRKFTVFMLSSQTVGNTWNTICVFFLLPKLRKQQGEQIPFQNKLPLFDIYAC